MSASDDDFDAQLADSGDDRAGLEDLADDQDVLDSEVEVDEDDDEDDTDDDSDESDDDDDYPDDAGEDDIDVVAALYREDGNPSGLVMPKDLANDLEEFIEQLRRIPGDAGALGVVSIDSDMFVLVRVRGKHVQMLLNDVVAANDWPIARDVADFLGADIPDDDEDGGPIGDLDMFADAGLPELELETLCSDLDAEPLDVLDQIIDGLGFADAFEKVAATFGL